MPFDVADKEEPQPVTLAIDEKSRRVSTTSGRRVAEGTRTPNTQIHSPDQPRPNSKPDNELRSKGESVGAEMGAVTEKPPLPIDPDLAALIDAWPTLPEVVKAGIVAMVKAAAGK
jgi:hypothetical protein